MKSLITKLFSCKEDPIPRGIINLSNYLYVSDIFIDERRFTFRIFFNNGIYLQFSHPSDGSHLRAFRMWLITRLGYAYNEISYEYTDINIKTYKL